jgi:serine/threonine-protein kinase
MDGDRIDHPRQLGRYQLLRLLGRGAMGMVYEGLDPKLDRRVAIKVIATSQAMEPALRAEYSARFIHEAKAVARLNHPNIVTVYDFGEQAGVAYLVMELIAGEELSSYFDDSLGFQLDFTLDDAVRMTCELLDAVGYAHQHGVIHRDIKPANVMLSSELSVKLTDFGVARMASVGAAFDEPGTMVGTPSCMSPEQVAGQPVGPRSDLFAVGLILYQFLTGERPFRGQGLFAVQQKIMYEQPAPPSLLNPLLSPMFDRIVLRALAKRPDERYPNARSMREDLKRALAGEDVALHDTLPLEVPAPKRGPGQEYGDPDATRIGRAGLEADPDATRAGAAPAKGSYPT